MCVFDHHIRSPGYVFFNATQLTCESSLTRQHSYPMIVPVVISRRCNCDACPSCSGLSQSRPGAPLSSFEGSTRRASPSLQSAVVANDLKCQCSHRLEPFIIRAETLHLVQNPHSPRQPGCRLLGLRHVQLHGVCRRFSRDALRECAELPWAARVGQDADHDWRLRLRLLPDSSRRRHHDLRLQVITMPLN